MNKASLLKNISESFTYTQYEKMVFWFALESKTSGEQTPEHISATLINAQRMKRIDKTCEIKEELYKSINALKGNFYWIVIAESWCGDGAQCIPVIAKMSECNSNIELKIILRDDNLNFMDSFLTNGSRGIPKLICIDKATNGVIGTWGPRPAAIQNMVFEFKKNNPGVQHEEFVTNLHLWYARDKTNSMQIEFIEIIRNWSSANG